MFDDVGSKLQTYAKVISILEIACSVIAGIAFMAEDSIGTGILVCFGGILFSIVSAWFLIGFGTIVEASEKQLGRTSGYGSGSSTKPMKDLCKM